VARERFIEFALVVVVSVGNGVVLTAYINDNSAGFEERRVSSPYEGASNESRKLAKEIDGKSFIGVEVATSRNTD
jgi:hypothetical protein